MPVGSRLDIGHFGLTSGSSRPRQGAPLSRNDRTAWKGAAPSYRAELHNERPTVNLGTTACPIATWDDVWSAYSELTASTPPNDAWVFRGQGKASHSLSTSLERALNQFLIPLSEAARVEAQLMREFRRHYSHYESKEPHQLDTIAWWSIMQHYGAPTRLLDWTFSFFVALFFALERASEDNSCKVFVCPANSLRRSRYFSRDELRLMCDQFKQKTHDLAAIGDESWIEQAAMVAHLLQNPRELLVLVNAFTLNPRLSIQQGVFVMPGDIGKTFEVNAVSVSPELKELCISTDLSLRRQALMHLRRMNITRATLFGDLAGYAESLYTRLAEPQFLSEYKPNHWFD